MRAMRPHGGQIASKRIKQKRLFIERDSLFSVPSLLVSDQAIARDYQLKSNRIAIKSDLVAPYTVCAVVIG